MSGSGSDMRNTMSLQHEYREAKQKEVDEEYRATTVLLLAQYVLANRLGRDEFFNTIDELDLWDDLVKLAIARRNAEMLRQVNAARETWETSVPKPST